MQEQIKEMELQQQKKRDQEEAEFSDNNFWRIQSATEAQADVDELLRELEATDETPGQGSEQTSQNAEEKDKSEESIKDDDNGQIIEVLEDVHVETTETDEMVAEKDEDNKEQKEESSTNS